MSPLLEVDHLTVDYPTTGSAVRAVDDVSFSIQPGEIIGLAGESGCGKSTTAHAILGILKPPATISGGRVLFEGKDLLGMSPAELRTFRWRHISLVFQSAMNALNPVMSIGDQFVDMIQAHDHVSKREALDHAADMLQMVGIERSRIKSFPHELSGGMRQRVVIAMAMALRPELIIMDEPTTALDVVVQREILQEIQDLQDYLGFAVLFITHDLSLLVEFSHRIGIMYAGKLVEFAPAAQLFAAPQHPYTVGLMNSFPALTGPRTIIAGIPGSPPDLSDPPSGCRFHPRCPRAMSRCSAIEPRLRFTAPDRLVACHLYEGQP
jgi:peptide/nickel transport system ATP-binding protein